MVSRFAVGIIRNGGTIEIQADHVKIEAVAHVQDRIAIAVKDGDHMSENRSCRASKKPVGDTCDSS